MGDFMPCKGCDEPEACEIEGRCLEPAARMLTSEELAGCCGGCRTNSAIETWMRRAIIRFCEVNAITLSPCAAPSPATTRDLQEKQRCSD